MITPLADVSGFLNIDKPKGITSHDVVAKGRRLAKNSIGKTKVGHAGTLDPMATGVLVICVGQATRLSEYAMQSRKRYRARVHLGVTTDTFDAEGEVIAEQPPEAALSVTSEDIEAELQHFRGDIEQIPPMYSAIKQGGKKLYELARAGKTVERKARQITIYDIQMSDLALPQFTLNITCSPGTYIRSIAHDLGEQLSLGGHLAALVRTQSGSFTLDDTIALETLLNSDDWQQHLINPTDALADWHTLHLSAEEVEEIRHGRRIPNKHDLNHAQVMALMPDGHLLAVLKNMGETWKPHKVFLPQS